MGQALGCGMVEATAKDEVTAARAAAKAAVGDMFTVPFVTERAEAMLDASGGSWKLQKVQMNMNLFLPDGKYKLLTGFLDAYAATPNAEMRFLFHGTAPHNLQNITDGGLQPETDDHIYFSSDAYLSHLYCNTPNAREYQVLFFAVLGPEQDPVREVCWRVPGAEPGRGLPLATLFIRQTRARSPLRLPKENLDYIN